MKNKQNQKKLSLNKLQMVKINNLSVVRGGNADYNSGDIPTATKPTIGNDK